jgi:hypothetical protein
MSYDTRVDLIDLDETTYRPGDRYEGRYQALAECGWQAPPTESYGPSADALKTHVATAHPRELAAAKAFYAHAERNYNAGGWDVIVETHELTEIAETFAAEGITNINDALKRSVLVACIDVWADRQADARNSAF